MDPETPNPLPEFEDTFQRFLSAGGFKLPALSEDGERDARDGHEGHRPTYCRHGRTTLTCAECNLLEGPKRSW